MSERKRVRFFGPLSVRCLWTLPFASGFLYTDFRTAKDYDEVLAYARQIEMVVWENAEKKMFFGRNAGHENIKAFITRRAGAGASGMGLGMLSSSS